MAMTPSTKPVLDTSCCGLLPVIEDAEMRLALNDDSPNSQGWTRSELRVEALKLADALAGPDKQLAFVLAENTAATVIGLLALTAAGNVTALIDPATSHDKLETLLALYQPDIMLWTAARALPEAISSHIGRWSLSGTQNPVAFAIRPDAQTGSAIGPALSLMLSTSGTTGSPKFVRLSGLAVATNARQIAASLDIDMRSVGTAHLPLHYSYGLSVVTSHLAVGGSVFIMEDSVTSPSFWTKIAACGGTHFPGVPFHYTVLARLGFNTIPGSVATFTQAGGKLDQRVQMLIHGKVTERGGRFFVMYGQTEASPRLTTLPAADFAAKPGSVGLPMPGGRIRILGVNGAEYPAGETGSVVYEGANVMMGYANSRDDLTLGDENQGHLVTGDLGWLDTDGYLHLAGRTQRFAKVAGLRLALDEIETEFSAIASVACREDGDRIAVYFENDIEVTLKARVKELAANYKIPSSSFKLSRVAEIPRKSSGKVDYARLKDITHV